MNRWRNYFFSLCNTNALMSKDPSTKVGAVIVRPNNTVVSMGWNGFPRGVEDSAVRLQNRDLKYPLTVHAEANAILSANEPVRGCTLYVTPPYPCATCAGLIIQSGIVKVVAKTPAEDPARWATNFGLSRQMFTEAGVAFDIITMEDGDW